MYLYFLNHLLLMRTLRTRLALVLLLCFARVLVPEAWVLALHDHQHTVDAPLSAHGPSQQKATVSTVHQHCAIDHFYDAAFELPTPPRLPLLVTSYGVTQSRPAFSGWNPATRATADSRGPPQQA
ncbi:hypothetical protein CDA63_18645 [Hymenobacter amundsenii]|uniref:Uncharacterized protein n=2 Tax=Hymenobacter amundsenii TaxID=2006685 RepID=A0A246FGE3_9BACT|nr:hypothetical protein CDA63_18645 [Hymenobacter amundsenii]